jgi:hypothetical protein
MMRAASALLQHLLGCKLVPKKALFRLIFSTLVVLRFGGVENRCAGFAAGVVHHDVAAPKLATVTSISFCRSATLLTSASTLRARSPNLAICFSSALVASG